MQIRAKVVADSVSSYPMRGDIHGYTCRLTTFQVWLPWRIWPELQQHRSHSLSGMSTRALRYSRIREQVIKDPYIPVYWSREVKGMSQGKPMSEQEIKSCIAHWLQARDNAVIEADALAALGVHHADVSPVLLPFMMMQGVVSATSFDNFFYLRLNADVKPEMQILAKRMAEAMLLSEPVFRWPCGDITEEKQWHLPFITPAERDSGNAGLRLAKASAARCARTSYARRDGTMASIEEEMALFDKLSGGPRIHAVPMEHPARPVNSFGADCGNFTGWRQFRKDIPRETCYTVDIANALEPYKDRDFLV